MLDANYNATHTFNRSAAKSRKPKAKWNQCQKANKKQKAKAKWNQSQKANKNQKPKAKRSQNQKTKAKSQVGMQMRD